MTVLLEDWDPRYAASAIHKELLDSAPDDTAAWAIVSQWAQASRPTQSIGQLLDALSELIVDAGCTLSIVRFARPVALELLIRAIDRLDVQGADWSSSELQACLYALARILYVCPGASDIVSLLFQRYADRYHPSLLGEDALQVVLLSFLRIANASPILLDDAPSLLHAEGLLAIAKDAGKSTATRILSTRLFARTEALSEAGMLALLEKIVGPPGMKGDLDGGWIDGSMRVIFRNLLVEEIDTWTLPVTEQWRIEETRSYCVKEDAGGEHSGNEAAVGNEDLSSGMCSFGGQLFLRQTTASTITTSKTFTETSSLRAAIQSLAVYKRAGLPILLSGPEACGKTSLISHACAHISNDTTRSPIVWLQLGDQSGIDAKSLIGSFVSSTSKPGSFEWAEGALTRAVKLGKWVVLEDIDKANTEILSVVKPLIESMSATSAIGARPYLDLGSRGKIQAEKGFTIFATRSIAKLQPGSTIPTPTFFGSNHWHEIHMNAFNHEDVVEIIKTSNPLLDRTEDSSVEGLVTTWQKLVRASTMSRKATGVSFSDEISAGTARIPSLHDLLKWCRRINTLLARANMTSASSNTLSSNQALLEETALEAIDVFLGALPPPVKQQQDLHNGRIDRFSQMIETIAENLQVDVNALWHAVRVRRPELSVQSSNEGRKTITIGRCSGIRQNRSTGEVARPSSTFALTGPAARLLERIAVCVTQSESCLIVGETGTGKTTVVQQLAAIMRKPLVALNLSQQTESADLLGGFKPLDPKIPATDLHNIWLDLFEKTFSLRRNAQYLQAERKAMQSQKWARLVGTWRDSIKLAMSKLGTDEDGSEDELPSQPPRKVMRTRENESRASPANENVGRPVDNRGMLQQWKSFECELDNFYVQHIASKRSLVFAFVEGPLVKAIRDGSWVLLDEINLATAETLECLSTLLQSSTSSVVLTEKGDLEPVERHADFRLFACMNPATDVGKKDLPNSLRSRFTELYAPSPDSDEEALVSIVESYIKQESAGDRGAILDVAQCFIQIKAMAREQRLADGANQRPHFSVRTLARALTFAKDTCSTYGLRRALFEGFCMAFTMLLDHQSSTIVRDLLQEGILAKAKNAKAAAKFVPARPVSTDDRQFVQIGSFWLEIGSQKPEDVPEYILTASVHDKLVGLARAALTRRSPVLIQGPTSAGKTSAVEYLARRTGHRFVRINNHEHTDLQEYLGTYATDPQTGKLAFREGLLVTAARRGDWIVLDELNLAPTDVLEALNRLLDDNRELQLPQTGEVITPHPHFMLFATQNPPGLYAGRKVLSRAFRNRFLEIHFDDVPQAELQTILANRCQIAPTYADKIVQVFLELQRRRQQERVFDTKQAFVTLRDLFRWGLREADGYEALARNGYMLIAERTRKVQDRKVVKDVIEQVMRVKIDEANLYNIFDDRAIAMLLGDHLVAQFRDVVLTTSGIVWTRAMQRLICLVASSLRYNEPVLLVGETGTGKTSVCEVLARLFSCQLASVNCHQNTDAADLLGGQRPLRSRAARREAARAEGANLLSEQGIDKLDGSLEDIAAQLAVLELGSSDDDVRKQARSARFQINQSLALFEWYDGPLVTAMRQGHHMLLDEISLADDSVLERLNSVLEPGRTLVLAEKGDSKTTGDTVVVRATAGFQIVATMNPGGDYGKKELSPALRNRFTEIYVPAVGDHDDIVAIIDSQWTTDTTRTAEFASKMIDFVHQLDSHLGAAGDMNIGLRDYIAWARFVDGMVSAGRLKPETAYVHGAMMTIIDGLPIHPLLAAKSFKQINELTVSLLNEVAASVGEPTQDFDAAHFALQDSLERFAIGGFSILKGTSMAAYDASAFNMLAKTPAKNAMRVLRAMQVSNRAVMLEGSPGAGKTSLIVALARASRHPLTRINLSDQTELSDLFGSDLPIEGGKPGEFGWRDAAFLQAMQRGEWVLLDEMNLASQSVLEGLNSCLDHRGSVYVPELGRSFSKHPDFRFFAAQNPQHQGGGRKGLPKSFLNRFTKVYVEELNGDDFRAILGAQPSMFSADQLERMVTFNQRLQALLRRSDGLSKAGQPWEFNLRDLLRWTELSSKELGFVQPHSKRDPLEYFGTIYLQRFRSKSDRQKVAALAAEVFERAVETDRRPWLYTTPTYIQIGNVKLSRGNVQDIHLRDSYVSHSFARSHLPIVNALGICVKIGLPAILIGRANAGKTALLRRLAKISGSSLQDVRLNSGTDTVDIIGGFEQEDARSHLDGLLNAFGALLAQCEHTISLHDPHLDSLDIIVTLKKLVHSQQRASKPDMLALVDASSSLLALDVLTQSERSKCQHLLDELQQLSQARLSDSDTQARFAWRDGPIITALRKGDWIILDDANLCSASVLDRLNSLLEPGGSIVLSERGIVPISIGTTTRLEIETVYPHPNFRIFFAMDPKYGELSRAMRNRGIELYLDSWDEEASQNDTANFHVSEASVQSLMPCLDVCVRRQPGGQTDLESEILSDLLLRSTYQHTIGLLSRLCNTQQQLDELHIGKSLAVTEGSQSVKAQVDALQRADLLQQPFDMQLNPQLYVSDADAQQHRVSRLLRLAGRAAHEKVALHRLQQNVDSSMLADLSVLHRSALCDSGIDIDMTDRDGRHGFTLVKFLISAMLQAVQSFFSNKTDNLLTESITAMEAMQDCTSYLMQVWASAKRNDLDASRNILSKVRKSLDSLHESRLLTSLSTISDLLDTMAQTLHLRSGHAMSALWRAHLPRSSSLDSQLLSKKLLGLVEQYRRVASSEIISHSTELIAMLMHYKTSSSVEEHEQALSLGNKVIEAYGHLSNVDVASQKSPAYHCSDALLCSALVLATQSDPRREPSQAARLLEQSDDPVALRLAVSLRALSFSKRDGQARSGDSSAWLASASSTRLIDDAEDMIGSHNLFLPLVTRAVVDLCMPGGRIPLSDWQNRQFAVERTRLLVTALSPADSVGRESQCFDVLATLLRTYRPYLQAALQEGGEEKDASYVALLTSVDSATEPGLAGALRAVHQDVRTTSATRSIAQAWEQMVILADDRSTTHSVHAESLHDRGARMLRFTRYLLHLYVANIPVDPLGTSRTQLNFLSFQRNRLQIARRLAGEIETNVIGTANSGYLTELDEQIDELDMETKQVQASTAIAVDRATDAVELSQLHNEMLTFVEQALSFDMVERLIGAAKRSISQIENMQKTIMSVYSRFVIRFAGLEDLAAPFLNALLLATAALGMLHQSCVLMARSKATSNLNELAIALSRFPTTASTLALSEQATPTQVPTLAVPTILAKLQALLRDNKDGLPMNVLFKAVSSNYEQIWHLWTLDEERRRQQKESDSSLYRTRNLDINVEEDAVLLEREFSQLFPQYEDVMDETNGTESIADVQNANKGSLLSTEHTLQLFHTHMALFGNGDVTDDVSYGKRRRDIVRQLLNKHYHQFSEQLDITSAAFQLELLSAAADTESTCEGDTDFYRGANPAEAVRLQVLVQNVTRRLDELIAAFPDQHVLQDIRRRCEMLLRLDVNSSVNRLLAGLEGLLEHTEDWQVYASSRTSLQVQRDEMTALIIQWRRLELHSWRTLLDQEDRRAYDETHTLWLTLFQLVVKSDHSTADEQREVVKLLDQFLRGSPLGQFEARVNLLRSMAVYVRQRDGFDALKTSTRVGAIITNTHAFFLQFLPGLVEYRLKKRKVIEGEINDFVKLASWKDTNTHALKTSAQKTHRKLHQCLRKYRSVLSEVVDAVLVTIKQANLQEASRLQISVVPDATAYRSLDCASSDGDKQAWHATQTPSHLINLATTVATLGRMVERQIGPGLSGDSFSEGIEDLSVTITERSQALAKATPAFLTEKNEKLVKSLEQRKRKAWSDLLKELRRIGLNRTHVDGVSSVQMSDNAFIFGLEAPATAQDSGIAVDPLHSLLSKMPVLRGTITSRERNDDVDVAQLQSALSYVESGMTFSVALRQRLTDLVKWKDFVDASLTRLQKLVAGDEISVASGEVNEVNATLYTYEQFWIRLTAATVEVKDRISQCAKPDYAAYDAHMARLDEYIGKLVIIRAALADLNRSSHCTRSLFFTSEERQCLASGASLLVDMTAFVRSAIRDVTLWHPYTIPLLELIEGTKAEADVAFAQSDDDKSASSGPASDTLISSILVVAQNVRELTQVEQTGFEELEDHAITKEGQSIASLHRALRLDEISTAINQLFRADPSTPTDVQDLKLAFTRVLPFLQAYENMLSLLSMRMLKCYNAQMKLNLTLCTLLTSLASRGFCKPRQEEADQGDADDAQDGEQLEGGVGLGEGQGAKDVTDTLEDDEQMEELQKDQDGQDEENETETKGEKDAREMEQDFDGKVEDVEDEGEGDEEKDDDASDQEIDDAVGEVDPLDTNAVDEKTWNGEDAGDDEGKDKDEKEMDGDANADKQDSGERQSGKEAEKEEGNAEDAGERNEGESSRDEKSKEDKGEEVDETEAERDEQHEQSGSEFEENEEDEHQKDGLGRAIDQEAKQDENLDLNLDEDMKMDNNEKDGSDMEDFQSISDVQEENERPPSAADEDIAFDEAQLAEEMEQGKAKEDLSESQEDDQSDAEEEAQLPREPGEEGIDDEEEEDGAQAEHDANDKDGGHEGTALDSAMQDSGAEAQDAAEKGDVDQDGSTQQQQSSRARKGQQARGDDADVKEQQETELESNAAEQSRGAANSGERDGEQGEVGDEHEPSEEQEVSAPMRSLGDALKDFRQNLDAIEERLNEQESIDGAGPTADSESKEVEHIADDEQSEMQALGAAQEEEALKRQDELSSAMLDETEEDVTRGPTAENATQEVEEPKEFLDQVIEEKSNDDEVGKRGGRGMMASDLRTSDQEERMNGLDDEIVDDLDDDVDEEMSQSDEEIIAETMEALQNEADEEKRLAIAGELWKVYNAATSEYAFALSEQLRLILTPTKATKLTGDFKTGKRLNMRKIIPFIASDYVKDKIWLRRHLPQKREYQVLICMDDSKSMSESHNKTLAFKSLALVCNALDRLEVGQVGVMKFGRTAELLKGFGPSAGSDSIGDAQGAQIFARLPFDQRGTNVLHLLRQSLDVLTEARQSHGQSSGLAGGQELWQLQIIISDGICQDHEGLRAMLRSAAEAHVMVVFAILDSLQQEPKSDGPATSSSSNNSILTMSSVEYKADANGRMQLQMKRYLDTFPFEYFVVVQDASDLPEVLSATLRQWAQRIAEM